MGRVELKRKLKGNRYFIFCTQKHSGLMVSMLDTGSKCLVSNPGWGHCVVFLGKIHYSHSVFLSPGV